MCRAFRFCRWKIWCLAPGANVQGCYPLWQRPRRREQVTASRTKPGTEQAAHGPYSSEEPHSPAPFRLGHKALPKCRPAGGQCEGPPG